MNMNHHAMLTNNMSWIISIWHHGHIEDWHAQRLQLRDSDHAARDDGSRFACPVDEFSITQHTSISTFSTNILSDSTTTLSSRTHFTTINATTVYHSSFHTAFCSNSTTTTTSGTHRPTANTSTICQLCVYTTSILSRFSHTTPQHSHARSSATTTLQRSHTQSSALTTTIWIIPHLPAYTTLNKHDTSTTTTSHTSFTAISNHYSFNSTTESQQAQPYTISHHTQEAQIHHQATQTTQIYETTSLTSQITPQIHHTTFQTPQITTPITTSTPAPFTSQATSLKHWQIQIQPSITHRTQTSSIFLATRITTSPRFTTTTTTNNTTTTSSTTTVTIRTHR